MININTSPFNNPKLMKSNGELQEISSSTKPLANSFNFTKQISEKFCVGALLSNLYNMNFIRSKLKWIRVINYSIPKRHFESNRALDEFVLPMPISRHHRLDPCVMLVKNNWTLHGCVWLFRMYRCGWEPTARNYCQIATYL